MRILHVIGSLAPRYGGPSSAVLAMCEGLARRGHDVEILTTDIDGAGRVEVPLGVPASVGGVRARYYPVRAPRSYGFSPQLGRALAAEIPRCDVVHVHSLYLFHGLAAGHLAWRARVPYVLRPHGTLDAYHRSRHQARKLVYDLMIERRNLRNAAAIHCASEMEQRHVVAAGVATRCAVIPVPVDVDAFARRCDFEPLLSAHPPLRGRTPVTFLGRITAKKQLHLVIDALAKTTAPVTLAVAGPDDEGLADGLRSRAEAHGLGDRVQFLGLLDTPRKLALLQLSSAVVLPSADENFGVSIVEAMAAGVPAIVSAGVAIADDIARAGAGAVVPEQPDAIATAIDEFASEPARRGAAGAAGQRLVRERFGFTPVTEALEELYVAIGATRGIDTGRKRAA